MTDALTKKQRESILSSIPAGRFGVVEDIASSVLFLASDEASYITGQTLHINGGMAMIWWLYYKYFFWTGVIPMLVIEKKVCYESKTNNATIIRVF